MGAKENLSRRDFIKLAILTSGGLAGFSVTQRISKYSLQNLEKTPREVYIDKSSIAALIDVPKPGSFVIHPNGQENGVLVNCNRDAFAEALITIAQKVDPENGARRIYSFLEKDGLRIRFRQGTAPRRPKNRGLNGTEYGIEGATTMPALTPFGQGPKITFDESYLQSYFAAKKSGDYLRTKHQDLLVFEELVHTYQDARNPRQHLLHTARYNSQEVASRLGLYNASEQIRQTLGIATGINAFDRGIDPVEVEAQKIVEEKILEKLVEVGLGESKPEQVFGRFFNFS